MNSAAQDIATILESSSVGAGTIGTDLGVSFEYDTPDAFVTVYDTGGYPPDTATSATLEKPTVQVRVRGAVGGYQAAYTKMKLIFDALHKRANQTVNSTSYKGIWAMGDVLFIGYDDNKRPIFTCNFRIHRAAT